MSNILAGGKKIVQGILHYVPANRQLMEIKDEDDLYRGISGTRNGGFGSTGQK